MKLSVIIPARDEEESIGQVIREIKNALPESEIIVVNDASRDSTPLIAFQEGAKVINTNSPQGYGKALKIGIREAKYPIIAIIDGDGTYPANLLPSLVKEIGKFDMVIGAREPRKIPWLRRPAKGVLQFLASYLMGQKIPDLNSGMRVFKREIIQEFYHLLPDGFSFTSTLTLAALSEGYRVKFIPILYFPRKGRSKINPFKDTFNFFLLIIRTILYFNPLKVFLPLSFFLLSLGLFILLYTALVLGKVMDITSIVVILTGVQVGVLGLLADLIVRRLKK